MRALLLVLALFVQQDAPKTEAPKAQAVKPVVLQDGWSTIENAKDKVSLAIPAGWEAWDLSSEDLAAVVDRAGERNPALKGFKKDILDMAKGGMYKLVVVQTAQHSLGRQFTNNAYLMAGPLLAGQTFPALIEQTVIELGGKKAVKHKKLNHPIGTGEEFVTEFPAALQDGSQAVIVTVRNFILNGPTVYVLTFSVLKDELKSIRPTLDKIRDSMRVG